MDSIALFKSTSEEDTEFAGGCLALTVNSPIVISLSGTLGAGKTRFVKGFANALEVDRSIVLSPTFSIVNHYKGSQRIQHLDVYRVADSDEMFELGLDEMFEEEAITLVEWGDRFPECMPDDYLKIDFQIESEETRLIRFEVFGKLEKKQFDLNNLTSLLAKTES